jgi:hypothetical protein
LAPGPELLAQVFPDCYPDGLGHTVDLNREALATNVDGLFGHCAKSPNKNWPKQFCASKPAEGLILV